MSLPYLARANASQVVKRNIRFSEVAECNEPARLAWRASRILARHTRDRAADRRADPQRYGRCPSLAERAIRRSPPPACPSQASSSNSCAGEADVNEGDDRKELQPTDNYYKTRKKPCVADKQKPVITKRSVEVRQPMPPAANVGQCPQSAVHGMQAVRN